MGMVWLKFVYFMQADGFPTLLFFPAGNKSFDPVSGVSSLLLWRLDVHILLLLPFNSCMKLN